MTVTGIIAEYNPLHRGHEYQIAQARRLTGADYIVVVMSGCFTQRGTPAVLDKYDRTRMALSGGADLVLELPVRFACASAEYFASGAVSVLNRLGCVDYLGFGSECGDTQALISAAALLSRGHRSLGLITGPINSLNSRARLRGVQKALFDFDVPYNVDATITGDWSRDSGYAAMGVLRKQGVTAVFAFSDEMAGGAFTYCMRHNIAVGKDLSLFGYDDSILARSYLPELSTVSPPLQEMGRRAARLLIAQINGETVSSEPTLIPCELILRDSVHTLEH